jgi:hypothetical protein
MLVQKQTNKLKTMRTLLTCIFLMLFGSIKLNAQIDTLRSTDLLNEISSIEKDSSALLPDKMMITQRILWGERGLMRNFNSFELTPTKRQSELKIRRIMLVSHQALGFATLAGMIAQGINGTRLYNGNTNAMETHESIAMGINIGYFTTASLSLFSPPKMLDERKGYSSIKLHKLLAIIHFSGMITTNILAQQLEGNPDLRPYHRAAAFTTFGAFAASMIVIKF